MSICRLLKIKTGGTHGPACNFKYNTLSGCVFLVAFFFFAPRGSDAIHPGIGDQLAEMFTAMIYA